MNMNLNNGSDSKLVKRAQVTAWTVLLISFALFVLTCVGGTAGVYWFLFKSPTDMTVRLWVSQGSLTVMQADGTNLLVNNNDKAVFVPQYAIIQSNGTSQGYLTFKDTYSEQVIATVFLLPNSNLTLRSATRPRFEWSSESYAFVLYDIAGHFAIDIPARIHRTVVLSMESPLGTARFGEDGSFFLDASDKREQLYTQAGTALMYTSDRAIQIEGGMQGVLQQDQNSLVVQLYPYQIVNWDSSKGYTFGVDDFPDDMANLKPDQQDPRTELPLLWGCTSRPDKPNETSGMWIRKKIDQRVTIQMQRKGNGLDHAVTWCQYSFGATVGTGLPVSSQNTLSVRAKFKIDFQDVTTCGILGTECPVMLELTYRALGQSPDDTPATWHHGFYAIRPSDDNNPIICDSCRNVHEQINLGTWFIYDSGDLFKLLPNQPVELISMKVYASGHQYDIALADLAVLVGTP